MTQKLVDLAATLLKQTADRVEALRLPVEEIVHWQQGDRYTYVDTDGTRTPRMTLSGFAAGAICVAEITLRYRHILGDEAWAIEEVRVLAVGQWTVYKIADRCYTHAQAA
jgi:hypothetical protein